jgi:NADH-quinone oxidoreductase subunit C
MTEVILGETVATLVGEKYPDAVRDVGTDFVLVSPEYLREVARLLKEHPELQLDFLANETAIDYYDHFEVVCHLISFRNNRSFVLKTQIFDRQQPRVPSLYPIWQGADFQEREIYDLMGISFDGHPDLRRILLWEGFSGHPLQKTFLG